MWTTAGRNNLLAGTSISHASLHSAYPGDSGTNEITGGTPAYARKAVTLNAAASGQRTTSNAPVFDVPAATTVGWIGFFDALTVGNCLAIAPNGGDPKEFAVDLTNNRILCEGHGYTANQKIVFWGGTVPTGLTAGTIYYVRTPTSADPDHFEVSATAGGAAIDISGQPGSGCMVSVIVEEVYGAQGTFTLAAGAVLALNN